MNMFLGLSYPKTHCLLHARPSMIIGTHARKATEKAASMQAQRSLRGPIYPVTVPPASVPSHFGLGKLLLIRPMRLDSAVTVPFEHSMPHMCEAYTERIGCYL